MTCVVYSGNRKEDTYLFVERADDFARVPEALLAQLGDLEQVLDLELYPGRRLARTEPQVVMRALRDDGFYLQLPPHEEARLSS